MRIGQLFWDDVTVGDDLPPLTKIASTQTLVKWAGASGDFNPLHFEDTFAASQGMGKPIIHGQLKRAWLVQLVSDWIGREGALRKLSCQHRAVDYPRLMKTVLEPQDGDTLLCKGKVTARRTEGAVHYIDCDIWVENGKGEATTRGSATVILPSKA